MIAALTHASPRCADQPATDLISVGSAQRLPLIGAHYEYQAWDHQDVVAKFRTVVDDRMRQLAIDFVKSGWGVHMETSLT